MPFRIYSRHFDEQGNMIRYVDFNIDSCIIDISYDSVGHKHIERFYSKDGSLMTEHVYKKGKDKYN
jgi:hypothetical protein